MPVSLALWVSDALSEGDIDWLGDVLRVSVALRDGEEDCEGEPL